MTILVTGARGTVGGAVIDELVARGVEVRASSHEPNSVDLPDRVPLVEADLSRPDTLDEALDGATSVFLYSNPEGIDGFIEQATKAGVQRVVLLSSAAVNRDDGSPLTQRHVAVEQALRASNLSWTFLRPGAFATNARRWAESIRSAGVVRAAYGEARTAPLHEVDLAEVAAEALAGTGHEGRVYSLSGPELLTQARQVELIGEAIGKDVRFEELTTDEARGEMGRTLPAPVVESLLAMFAEMVDHPPALNGVVVEQVTGHPARTYATWAADHAGEFT
jgi:uncharacterized protein YbjT (DUF2867 family)